MKYVSELTADELITLECAHKSHPSARVRSRAHVIILSHKHYKLKEIADICQMTRQTVSAVTGKWEKLGLAGLYDSPRPGRPGILTPEDEDFIFEMAEEEPRSLNKIIAVPEDQRGKKISKSTLKRVMKKKLTWKRIRKSLKGKRDEEKFRSAQEKIRQAELRRENGEIDLYYFDEAGFSPVPYVPYAWQPKGEYIEIPSARSRSLSVLAFMNKDNDCAPFVFEGRTDTDVVVACFDSFSETVTQKTFVIMDNAPVHKSKKFLSCLPGWHKKGLNIRFLPPYSPELNLAEVLWRKIKYEWLPFSAYTSFSILTEWVESILLNFGSQYTIEFAKC